MERKRCPGCGQFETTEITETPLTLGDHVKVERSDFKYCKKCREEFKRNLLDGV